MIALPRLPLSVWLGAALAVSVGIGIVLARQWAAAEAACEARIAAMAAETDRKAAKLETAALEISRDVTRDAEAEVRTIEVETIRYVDRIRTVRVPVAAECHGPMPDSVRDALTDAARAANRGM